MLMMMMMMQNTMSMYNIVAELKIKNVFISEQQDRADVT